MVPSLDEDSSVGVAAWIITFFSPLLVSELDFSVADDDSVGNSTSKIEGIDDDDDDCKGVVATAILPT